MRLRRMCEQKKTGKCNVKETVAADYRAGGERRELLEIALLETLMETGTERSAHSRVKQVFSAKVEHVKERLQEREKEVHGSWLTVERMKSVHSFSEHPGRTSLQPSCEQLFWSTWLRIAWLRSTVKQVVGYCGKFPSVLTRPGAYVCIYMDARTFHCTMRAVSVCACD